MNVILTIMMIKMIRIAVVTIYLISLCARGSTHINVPLTRAI